MARKNDKTTNAEFFMIFIFRFDLVFVVKMSRFNVICSHIHQKAGNCVLSTHKIITKATWECKKCEAISYSNFTYIT